jgi:hypothetical protein
MVDDKIFAGRGKEVAGELIVSGGDASPILMRGKKFSILCRNSSRQTLVE